jgi:hypothetical protein
MVPKSGDCFGKPLHPTHGIRQGDVISNILFNIAVDAVLQEWDVQVTKAQCVYWTVSLASSMLTMDRLMATIVLMYRKLITS